MEVDRAMAEAWEEVVEVKNATAAAKSATSLATAPCLPMVATVKVVVVAASVVAALEVDRAMVEAQAVEADNSATLAVDTATWRVTARRDRSATTVSCQIFTDSQEQANISRW